MAANKAANEKGKRDKVVLAYSGGLDTSVDIHWLQENYDVDVVAISVDVGQPETDGEEIVARAYRNGAIRADFFDVRKEFVEEYVWPLVKANGMYQDVYPLSTAIARPLMAKTLVKIAHEEGAKYIAHGCTGKGNDQVRFDAGIKAQDPNLEIIAPQREWIASRDDEIDYAAEHGIEIKAKKNSPYSRDENLWGASCECGALENAWDEPPEGVWIHTVAPEKAPNTPTYVEIGFEKGVPVSLDGKEMDGVELIDRLNKIAGENGVGRIDHVEDRLVGIKSRETYECPADSDPFSPPGQGMTDPLSYIAFYGVHKPGDSYGTPNEGIRRNACKKPSKTFSIAPNADPDTPAAEHSMGFNLGNINATAKNRVGYNRHSGQANYLFVDGHVESRQGSQIQFLKSGAPEITSYW